MVWYCRCVKGWLTHFQRCSRETYIMRLLPVLIEGQDIINKRHNLHYISIHLWAVVEASLTTLCQRPMPCWAQVRDQRIFQTKLQHLAGGRTIQRQRTCGGAQRAISKVGCIAANATAMIPSSTIKLWSLPSVWQLELLACGGRICFL